MGQFAFHLPNDKIPISKPSPNIGLPLVLASYFPYIGLMRLARIAYSSKAEGLASAAIGLAYGGQAWIWIVVLTLPASDTQALDWLRGHAWDYFGAGGLAAISWHLLVSKDRRTRMPTLQFTSMAIAAITSFTADASNIMSVSLLTMIGGITGIVGNISYTWIAEPSTETSNPTNPPPQPDKGARKQHSQARRRRKR